MEARLVEGDGGVATLVRAALPAVPGVNLLPGIRKTGGDRPRPASPSDDRRWRSGAST